MAATTTAMKARTTARDLGAEADEAARRCQDRPDDPAAWEGLRAAIWGLLKAKAQEVRHGRSYLDFDDLVQEAWVVATESLRTWDRAHGVRFTTYMARNLPCRLHHRVGEATGPTRVPAYLTGSSAERARPELRERATAARRPALSLDRPDRETGETPDVEARPQRWPFDGDDDDALRAKAVLARRLEALRRAAPRVAAVIDARYPASGEREKLRVIAAALGVSRARVEQIERKGLAMLRTGLIWPEGRVGAAVRVDEGFSFTTNREEAA